MTCCCLPPNEFQIYLCHQNVQPVLGMAHLKRLSEMNPFIVGLEPIISFPTSVGVRLPMGSMCCGGRGASNDGCVKQALEWASLVIYHSRICSVTSEDFSKALCGLQRHGGGGVGFEPRDSEREETRSGFKPLPDSRLLVPKPRGGKTLSMRDIGANTWKRLIARQLMHLRDL